jgi:hypothetical protein
VWRRKKKMAVAPNFGANDHDYKEPNPPGRHTRHVVEHCLRTSQATLREEISETRAVGTSVRAERDSSVKSNFIYLF